MHDDAEGNPGIAPGPSRGLSPYGAGVVAGVECRRLGGALSLSRRVAINDDFSCGFRAGYFQRRLESPRTALVPQTNGLDIQWWGHNREHGWVVLDRRIQCNAPGLDTDLLFLRCSDAATYVVNRESWSTPAYRFAPSYIRELASAEAGAALAELKAFKVRWPEFERQIERRLAATRGQTQSDHLEAEKARKKAATDKERRSAPARG